MREVALSLRNDKLKFKTLEFFREYTLYNKAKPKDVHI